MNSLRIRLTRIIREFISRHLPPLMGLLAEEEVERDEQRRRADELVRGLLTFELTPGLSDGHRRRPVAVTSGEGGSQDGESDRDVVEFNPDLIEDVEEGDILSILEEPVTHFLDLSAMKTGLVLQIRDDERLTSLYNRASREADVEPLAVVEIPGVIEDKFRLLEQRSAELAIALTGQAFEPHGQLELDLETFLEHLDDEWPAWDELRSNTFIDSLIERVELIVRDYDAVPDADKLVELCWESLELSSQSFIRHAARELRPLHGDVLDVESTLEDLADIVAEQEGGVPNALGEWAVFAEIEEIWQSLFRTEQRVLSWSPERRPTPSISAFKPPIETFYLNEPDGLPWEYPLLCWSMRERQALRDLLEGHQRTIANRTSEPTEFAGELDRRGTNDTLALSEGQRKPEMRVASFQPENDHAERRFRIARAVRANYNKLRGSFRSLDTSQRGDVLERLRAGYDGYFDGSQVVWERRFQAWKQLDDESAFRLLTHELRRITGEASLFDPFGAANEAEARRIPLFEFIVAWSEGARKATVRVPLVALKSTFENAPVRIRCIEVPEADEQPCRWLGDCDVLLQTLVDQPTEKMLRSIRNDTVGLMFERP